MTTDKLKKASLDVKVTYRKRKYLKSNLSMSLSFILGEDGLLSESNPYALGFISQIQAIRDMVAREIREHTDDSRSKEMKSKLPVWFPSGLFDGPLCLSSLKSFSGLICIDIDEQDNNLTTVALKQKVSQLPFVLYAGLSCRRGIFCLIRLPMDSMKFVNGRVDDSAFLAHFKAIQRDFLAIGIVIDPHCSNVNRGRFLSYDPSPYWNLDAEVFTDKAEEPRLVISPDNPPPPYDYRERNFRRVDSIITRAERYGIDLAPTLRDWWSFGRAFANDFGEEGRGFFLRISALWSRVNNKQHKTDPNKEYDACLTYPGNVVNIGKFFKVTRGMNLTAKRGEY